MFLARLLLLCTCGAKADVLKVGGIYSSGMGLRGKAAFDSWASWANSNSTLNFTVDITWHEYTNASNLIASVNQFVSDGVHVIIPPYTTALTKATVDAVPLDSTIAILAWGGASDSIFTSNCLRRKCFGGFTVASKYIEPSLRRVQVAANGDITVGLITNNNSFSSSVQAGALAYIGTNSRISVATGADVTLSAYQSSLSQADLTLVGTVISAAPDVVVVIGHPGDVEEVVTRVQSDTNYKPKAIIAVNAFASPSNYNDQAKMENVIMPEQWDENNAADTLVGWTPAAFRTALGDSTSYHSAAAGGLAVAVTHAIHGNTASNRMSTIAEQMSALAPTQTFYGQLSWNSQGLLQKPMYGKQRQGSSYVIVAPEGDIVYPMEKVAGYASVSQGARTAPLALAAFLTILVSVHGQGWNVAGRTFD